ncbi:hypothetical protein CONPUDRAFT_147284 [Coniophora puteana RWD-64-598 SS2]|uniref:Uncharacterized protein n=1 Tax=Coniophora puteana (strain RWD-64-598) TaxID=741705 RepID=A0A5M3M8Y2_CONPW|nr:uncharacterized protein CONPUDRAFT_147284 [Coniophora puteana RWD-64-598 SS2]EIW75101.1 hypothetical protein CONPUDRAFT_147284 [Coniophora puteana RWD-64-598 SS2]
MTSQSNLNPLPDTNFLAFVAHALDVANNTEKRQRPERDCAQKRAQADILDSLAYIAVCEEKHHVVATAALLPGGSSTNRAGLEILVSENGTASQTVIDHLQSVLDRLILIRKQAEPLFPKSRLSPRFPEWIDGDAPNLNAFERSLVDLEVSILRHSWKKLRRRATKDSQHVFATDTANDVCDPNAMDRVAPDQRPPLAKLQASTDEERELISEVVPALSVLARIIQTQAPTDNDVRSVRGMVLCLEIFRQKFEGNTKFMKNWNRYTRLRLESQQANIKKPPDFLRWLTKLTAIHRHYIRIANVAASNTLLGTLLVDRPVVKAVENTIPCLKLVVDHQRVEDVLRCTKCKIEASGQRTVGGLVKMLADTLNLEYKDETLVVEKPAPVHGACKLLAATHGRAAIAYIGVSKQAPCAFCDIYFEAYRKATKTQIITGSADSDPHAGSRNQTPSAAPWAFPHLRVPELDTEIENHIRPHLLRKINEGWAQFGRPSRSSQSADVYDSDDDTRPIFGMCDEKAFRKKAMAEQRRQHEKRCAEYNSALGAKGG